MKKRPLIISVAMIILLMLAFKAPGAGQTVRSNVKIQSFRKAKKTLERFIYDDHRVSFYCGCKFTRSKEISDPNGYVPRKRWRRANRIEWEHVVPAHAFGQSFTAWVKGNPECIDSKNRAFKGRNCARKTETEFRYMEADMHNLVPAVGEINGLRSNYSFALIPGEKRNFGSCDVEIENRKAEPRPEIRGDIARTYKYMEWAYPGHGVISNKNRKLFDAWDRQDPVDDWECERARRVEQIQGNQNPFVQQACMQTGKYYEARLAD